MIYAMKRMEFNPTVRACILFLSLLFLFQTSYAQAGSDLLNREVKLSLSGGTVREILLEITELSQINFSYSPQVINLDKYVDIEPGKEKLADILNQLFRNDEIRYTQEENVVILSRLKKYTVSGFLENSESGERLIGASVYDSVSRAGTISNNYGYFSMTLPEGEVTLKSSYVGYSQVSINLLLKSDTSIIIRLEPGLEIDEVTVLSKRPWGNISRANVSTDIVMMDELASLPTLLGEGDVMKSIQLLPGIQFGTEASSGINVRGGSPEQNLILLDGAPVYNSNHAFGLFSVFNSDAIKSLSIIKGGFPARYGGRLSSIIDVRMKEGNNKKFHGNINIGTIASKFTLEGPVIKEKSSFIISARRTYVDLFLPKSRMDDLDIPYFYFWDINSKINTKLSRKDRVFLSLYMGHDQFLEEERYTRSYPSETDNEDKKAQWGNETALLRWNHVFSNKLFSNLSMLYSKYGLLIDLQETEIYSDEYYYEKVNYNSGIKDLSAALDFDYYPYNNHTIRFGASYIHHSFNPGELRKATTYYYVASGEKIYPPGSNIDSRSYNDTIYADEFRTYIEDDFSFASNFYANIGLHYSGFIVQDEYYSSVEPRITFKWAIKDNLAVQTAYARMKQYIHLLTHSSMGLPTDLWLPVTTEVKPQYSDQYTVGLVYSINDMLEVNIESYYKSMSQLYAYKEGVDYLSANNTWEENIELGSGRSYGLEFILRKKYGKIEGWVSYTYSKSSRQFESVNEGKPFPYKYDRTHQLNIVGNYLISPKFKLNATWIYATGMAYTLATKKYVSFYNVYMWNAPGRPSGYINSIEARNNARMPDYHRLDLSLQYTSKGKKTTSTWALSIYNVYARFNPYLIYWDNEDESTYTSLKSIALFTIIPSLSYRLEF